MRFYRYTLNFLMLACAAEMAIAATYPTKPIELLVPYPPGASTDMIARTLQKGLAAQLGQPIVVENQAGAGGNIGVAKVARAANDGYKLVLSTNATVTINPHVYANTGFDVLKDLTPVAAIAAGPLCIAVNNKTKIKNIPELVAAAKEQNLSYGTPGPGSPQHITGELLKELAKVKITHIPYRGIGPALTDLIGGTLPMMISTCSAVLPHTKTENVSIIAVTQKDPFSQLPDVDTVSKYYPDFDISAWFGIYAPKNTSTEIVKQLNTAINNVLGSLYIKKVLTDNALDSLPGSPQALNDLTVKEYTRWKKFLSSKPEEFKSE